MSTPNPPSPEEVNATLGSADHDDTGSSDPPSNATLNFVETEASASSSSEEEATRREGPDPLYDARADDSDARWVERNLIYESQSGEGGQQLHCPSCFTLLCLQCQPHEKYIGQFRAVFVQNCVVNVKETVRVRVQVDDDPRRNGHGIEKGEYLPVSCKICLTEVAVLDQEEVYHFCNVMY